MTTFGITAIRWNADHSEVAVCLVHEIDRDGDQFVLKEGMVRSFTEVADLITTGDQVYSMEKDDSGRYDKRDAIVVLAGAKELLGSKNNSLFELPDF